MNKCINDEIDKGSVAILHHQNMFIVQLIELCPSFDSYKKNLLWHTLQWQNTHTCIHNKNMFWENIEDYTYLITLVNIDSSNDELCLIYSFYRVFIWFDTLTRLQVELICPSLLFGLSKKIELFVEIKSKNG